MTAIKGAKLAAFFKGSTATGALVVTAAAGCAGAYVGVGVIDLTLDEAGIDQPECHVEVIPETILREVSVVHTTDPVKRITFATGAGGVDAVAESAFSIKVWRLPATLV